MNYARPMLSTPVKLVLGALALVAVLFLVTQVVDRIVNNRVDSKIKAAQDESDKHKRAAEESAQREEALKAELAEQKTKTAEAEARAEASAQALENFRTIRVRVEGDYNRVRNTPVDQATPVNAAFLRALCEQQKQLGVLPEGTKCEQ